MKIRLKLGDGSFTTVDAWWHPSREMGGVATGGTWTRREGLWTTDAVVSSHLREVNKVREEESIPVRDLSDMDAVIQGIQCAEAPLEIFAQGECDEPWKCTGNLVRELPAGNPEE